MNTEKKTNTQLLTNIANQFELNQEIKSIISFGTGLINKTYLVETINAKKYTLQEISKSMGDIDKLMENVSNITNFINSKGKNTLRLVKTKQDKPYLKTAQENYRMYEFVDGTIYDTINKPDDFKKAGIAFAEFSKALEDFPIEKINITLPDFHNTQERYENFLNALSKASPERLRNSEKEILFLQSKNTYVDAINNFINLGLPQRVIHGDTKINNVIFGDEKIYVIDFDTIMKSYLCYDYGDAIRSGCNKAKENAPANQVQFSHENFKAFTQGYLSVWKDISALELKSLQLAPMIVTYELCLRFLTDYLQNDIYFNTNYSEENLDRCKNQIELLSQMEKNQYFINLIFNISSKKNEQAIFTNKKHHHNNLNIKD